MGRHSFLLAWAVLRGTPYPPVPVQASFNEVNQAQQEKEKLINEARRDYNKVIPLAEREKDQRFRKADG